MDNNLENQSNETVNEVNLGGEESQTVTVTVDVPTQTQTTEVANTAPAQEQQPQVEVQVQPQVEAQPQVQVAVNNTPVQEQQPQVEVQPQPSVQPQPQVAQSTNNANNSTGDFDAQEISNGKGMAIIAYIGLLALIPFFAEKNNKYVVFHAKQGMNLLIIEVIGTIALSILSGIAWAIFWGFGTILGILNFAFGVFALVLSIMGIVNACNGKAKELPVISSIKIIK